MWCRAAAGFDGSKRASDDASRVAVAYIGKKALTLVRPFAGTLIAPEASVLLANWEPSAFRGAFYAQELSVLPGTELSFVPFRGRILQ